MRNLFILLLCVSISINEAYAQIQAILECHYSESYKPNNLRKNKVKQDEMVLRVGREGSEFYSLWRRSRDYLTDSLKRRGASLSDIIGAQQKQIYPLSVQYYTIYKNYPQKGVLTHTDNLGMQYYQSTEPMPTLNWDIRAEQKEIAGYKCQKAVARLYGREWHVWFTADIPFSDGPWKLHGLPGLILEAEDAEGDYRFSCIEIKQINASILMPKRRYVKCDRETMRREILQFEEDVNTFMQKQGRNVPTQIDDNTSGKGKNRISKKEYNYIER